LKHATLRQLKVFASVARHLSFARAAEELHLTQPAISGQIRKLEEHAGVALFEQVGRKTHLTAAGADLLGIVRSIIEQFEVAEHAMTQHKGVSGGKLNVAAISAGDYFLPRLLVEFIGRHHGVTLNFTVHNREGLLAHLAANLTDLAIMARPPDDDNMVSEPFAPHPYVVVAAPSHALAGKKRIEMKRLVREPFVVREKGSDTWNSMQDGFGAHLSKLNIAMEIKSTETIKQAVMAGMGVSFLSAHTISRELQAGSLAVLDVQGFPLMLNWYLVHRKTKRLPPVAQAFKNFLLEEGAALIEQTLGLPAKRMRS
jgi:LysR family transcriptional regulator, low CO2-responsive transcriptional regulator